jgi:uncharacterized protein YodC (DUF2158 family)
MSVGSIVVHKTAQDLPLVISSLHSEGIVTCRFYNRVSGEYGSEVFSTAELFETETTSEGLRVIPK